MRTVVLSLRHVEHLASFSGAEISQLAFNQLGDRRLAREVRLDSGDVRLGFVLALIALFELDERTFHGWNVPVQLAKDIVG